MLEKHMANIILKLSYVTGFHLMMKKTFTHYSGQQYGKKLHVEYLTLMSAFSEGEHGNKGLILAPSHSRVQEREEQKPVRLLHN